MPDPIFQSPTTNPFGLTNVVLLAKPTLVDIDGDGDLDAFVGNSYGNTLFYRNTGSASAPAFATPTTNPFGLTDVGDFAKPTFVDIDGDGDLDAFVGNSYGNTLFYRNTGSASAPAFATPSENPFGLTNVGFFAAPTFVDIDGDGDLDAFVGNSYGNTLFYRNTGSASAPAFATPSENPFGLTNVGVSAAPTFVDIDGDGDLDAFVGNTDGNTLFYGNTGSASAPAFAAPSTNPFGLTDVGDSAAPTLVDIDGDGDLDAFVGNYDGNTLFYQNVPPSLAIAATNASQTEGNTGTKAFTFTVTRSGDTSGSSSANWAVTGSGANQANATDFVGGTLPSGTVNFAATETSQVITINVSGDTTVEPNEGFTVTLSNPTNAGITTATATGTILNDDAAIDPTFQSRSTNPFGLTDVGFSAVPTFVDIDGDGDLDAFVGNSNGNTLFYRNTGSASAPAFASPSTNPFGLTNVGLLAAPTLVDIDGDGDLDAFAGNSDGNTLFYRNTGTKSAPAFATPSTNPFGLTDVGLLAAPTLVDIDGDGDLDAFAGNSDGNTLFYRNTGTKSAPAFATPSTNPFGLTDVGDSAAPTFVDIDGDGDLDAFVGNRDGNTLFYGNTGTKSAPAFATPSTNPFGLTDVGFYAKPTFVDIDGDGDLDAFVGNRDGNTLFYQNAPSLAIAATNASQTEGNTGTKAFTFTVTRSGDTSGSSSANWAVTGSGANPANATDFVGGTLPSGTVNFAATETSKVITVNVSGDTTVEPDEGFTVTLSNPTNAGITTATATGTILNDDAAAALAITPLTLSQTEGNTGTTAFTFTVTRSGDTSGTSSANWAVTGSGANQANATDFVGGNLPSGTVNFAATETSQVITINVSGDTTVELDEGFTVTLSNPTNTTITTADATGTIINDDTNQESPPIISVQPSQVLEGNSGTTQLIFQVNLSARTGQDVTVDYTVTDGTATVADDDYVSTSGTLRLNAGTLSGTITVLVKGDTKVESDETLTLNLSNPVGATISSGSATSTIINDDSTSGLITLTGTSGNDNLLGNPAAPPTTVPDEVFQGLAGNDNLFGYHGTNTFEGGSGADYLLGYSGKDTFVYPNFSDSLLNGMDTIARFNSTENDRLKLSSLPSKLSYAGVITGSSLSNATTQAYAAVNLGANESLLFKYGSSYYLSVNDGTAAFTGTADLLVKFGTLLNAPTIAGTLVVTDYFTV